MSKWEEVNKEQTCFIFIFIIWKQRTLMPLIEKYGSENILPDTSILNWQYQFVSNLLFCKWFINRECLWSRVSKYLIIFVFQIPYHFLKGMPQNYRVKFFWATSSVCSHSFPCQTFHKFMDTERVLEMEKKKRNIKTTQTVHLYENIS